MHRQKFKYLNRLPKLIHIYTKIIKHTYILIYTPKTFKTIVTTHGTDAAQYYSPAGSPPVSVPVPDI